MTVDFETKSATTAEAARTHARVQFGLYQIARKQFGPLHPLTMVHALRAEAARQQLEEARRV